VIRYDIASTIVKRRERGQTRVERARSSVREAVDERSAVRRRETIAAAGRSWALALSSLDTSGKFVLDIRFFSSIIYILYEGESLRPPVVTLERGGVM
jgi:hypothetical protein